MQNSAELANANVIFRNQKGERVKLTMSEQMQFGAIQSKASSTKETRTTGELSLFLSELTNTDDKATNAETQCDAKRYNQKQTLARNVVLESRRR